MGSRWRCYVSSALVCMCIVLSVGCAKALLPQPNYAAHQGEAAARFDSYSKLAAVQEGGSGTVTFVNATGSGIVLKVVLAQHEDAWTLIELADKSEQSIEVGPGKYLLKVRLDTPGSPSHFRSGSFDVSAGADMTIRLQHDGDQFSLGSLGMSGINASEFAR